MKVLYFLIYLILFGITAEGQKNFQGTIEFRMISPDTLIDVRITAHFKHDRIKFATNVISIAPGIELKNETIILDFGDSSIYRIKDEERYVQREMMLKKNEKEDEIKLKPADSSSTIKILDYLCRRYSSGNLQKNEIKDGNPFTTTANLQIWYADKLIFDVPDRLHSIQMVPLFTNDHVALGSDIKMQAGGRELSLTTRATFIKKGKVKQSVFLLPKKFPVRVDD